MRSRPHGGKPALALWMLVAIADLAVLAAAAGPVLMLTILFALLMMVIAGRGLWLLHRQPKAAAASRTQAVVRRRA